MSERLYLQTAVGKREEKKNTHKKTFLRILSFTFYETVLRKDVMLWETNHTAKTQLLK